MMKKGLFGLLLFCFLLFTAAGITDSNLRGKQVPIQHRRTAKKAKGKVQIKSPKTGFATRAATVKVRVSFEGKGRKDKIRIVDLLVNGKVAKSKKYRRGVRKGLTVFALKVSDNVVRGGEGLLSLRAKAYTSGKRKRRRPIQSRATKIKVDRVPPKVDLRQPSKQYKALKQIAADQFVMTTTRNTATVSGSVEDFSGYKSVTVGSHAVEGTFSLEIPISTDIAPGDDSVSTQIDIVAEDKAGNKAVNTLDVKYKKLCRDMDGEDKSRYNICLDLVGVDEKDYDLYASARERWESIIVGDLPGTPSWLLVEWFTKQFVSEKCTNFPSRIDDVYACIEVGDIDEPGVLGYAFPYWFRIPSLRPLAGYSKLRDLSIYPQYMESIIQHELAHIFGFSGLWYWWFNQLFKLNAYIGPNGVREWKALRPSTCSNVKAPPIETEHGDGTAFGHWDEACFGNELMTGLNYFGIENKISKLTVAALDDLGYTVDYTEADPYSLANPTACGCAGTASNGFDPASNVEPQTLSEEGRKRATKFGKGILAKIPPQNETQTGYPQIEEAEATNDGSITDLFIDVLYEENGRVYSVSVIGDKPQ